MKMKFERIGVNARFVMNGVWCVPVHVLGTAGSLAKFGFALTDGADFWDFQESTFEDVENWS